MQEATKFAGVSGGQGANAPVNPTDLLDRRSVGSYALTFLYVSAEVPLPASLLQHTTGLACVQCRVIHMRV
jgi:hypothetical protein